jgi:sigma-E factor negative regulatory protein RseC
MIEQRATVLSSAPGVAIVRGLRESTCGSCSASGGCGTSLIDRFLGRRPAEIEVSDGVGVKTGETVVIGMPEATVLKAAVAAYLGPLAGLMLGAILGSAAGDASSEAATLAGAAVGFALALRAVSGYSRRLARDPRSRPVLLRRDEGRSMTVALR